MAISYVGGKVAGTAGQGGGSIAINSGLTGGSDAAAAAGDLVVVTVCIGTAARTPSTAIATPTGYTPLTKQGVTATASDTMLQTCYKIMGGTPDTAVTIPASGNNADGIAYTIQVFRGVDQTTPMDATATYATGSGVDNLPDGAAITPVTAGAWIVVCGGGGSSAGGTFAAAALTNFLTANGADTNDSTVGSGYYTGWTSGAYDPAKFTSGSTGAANSWACTTIALRPAAPVLTGTITSGATEADIVAGGKTAIITLQNDTWIAAGAGAFDLQRDEIIAGFDSGQAEATGWDAVVKAGQSLGGVVRTSNTVVTVTWDAFATYNITAQETITVTVPGTAVASGVSSIANITFNVAINPTDIGAQFIMIPDSMGLDGMQLGFSGGGLRAF